MIELTGASRLIVNILTGAKRWTLRQAQDRIIEHLGQARDRCIRGIER
jgi:uncharacterized protein (DUF885 family)